MCVIRVLICIVHTATSIRPAKFCCNVFCTSYPTKMCIYGRLTMWIMSTLTFLAGYSYMTGRVHVQRTLIPDPPTRVLWLVSWTYMAQVLTTPFPVGNVPFGGLLGSVPKPTICSLCPLQNKHIFNSHLNYMYLNLKSCLASEYNLVMFELKTQKCFEKPYWQCMILIFQMRGVVMSYYFYPLACKSWSECGTWQVQHSLILNPAHVQKKVCCSEQRFVTHCEICELQVRWQNT